MDCLETRVHNKIMKYGANCVYEFTEEEHKYFMLYVEPVVRLVVQRATATVN